MLSAVWQHLNRSSSLKGADNRNPFTHAVHKGCCETHFVKDWLQKCDHQHCFFNLNLNQTPIFNILFYQNNTTIVWGPFESLHGFRCRCFSLRCHWDSFFTGDWLTQLQSFLFTNLPIFFFSLQIKPGCPLPAREKVTQDVTCLSQ